MTEQFGDGVQVSSVCKGEGGEAVTGNVKGHVLGYAGFFDEGAETDIGIVDLIGQFVEDAVFGQVTFPFREPFQGIVRERDGDAFPGFLHGGFYLGIAILADCYLFPGEFADIGVSEAAEAAEQECRFDVVVGFIFGFDYFLDFLEGQVAAGFLFGVGFEFPVDVFPRVLDDDSVSFSFVQGYHNSGEEGFFVDIAERLWLAALVFRRFVKVPDVRIEVLYETYEEVFVYMIECDVFSFVAGYPFDGAAHQNGTGVLAIGIIFGSHLLAVGDEVEFPAAVSVLESVFSVLDVDDVLGFDCVCESQLLSVPQFVLAAGLGSEVEAEEFVFTDAVYIAVKVDGLVSVLEGFVPQFYRFL